MWNVKGSVPAKCAWVANRLLSSPSASDLPPELLRGSMCSVSFCFFFSYQVKKKHFSILSNNTGQNDSCSFAGNDIKNRHCCTNMFTHFKQKQCFAIFSSNSVCSTDRNKTARPAVTHETVKRLSVRRTFLITRPCVCRCLSTDWAP